jgi:tripartite-type tricarboxylate transporter receptor subunit TctC
MRVSVRTLVLLMSVLVGAASARAATDYPNRPVRVIVPFAPGGSLDMLARTIGRGLAERLGQQFVVENRSGAGGNLGHDAVAKARPDGYTMLVTSEPLTINPALFPNLPYDVARDLAPVTLVASLSQVLIVRPASKLQTFADYLAAATTRPEPVDYATAGLGSPGHLAGEQLRLMTGAALVHVPYRGGGPAVADVAAGQIESGIMTLPAALALIQSGAVRALAVTSRARAGVLPDVPTIGETVPGFAVDSWQAVLVPAGTPADIVGLLNREIVALVAQPAVRDLLDKQGFDVVGSTPGALGQRIAEELAKWRRFAKQADIHID